MNAKRFGSTKITLVAGTIALASLACSVALFDTTEATEAPPVESQATVTPIQIPTPLPDDVVAQIDNTEQLLINIYERVNPSVVNINVSAQASSGDLTDFGSGSGFVYDTKGHIVTNYHVIADADEVRVTFSNGIVMIAQVIGSDSFADLAVLKVDPPADFQLVPIELGDSDTLKVGQSVIAIGNPFGLSGSMTVGIVSGVGRVLPSVAATGDGARFSNPLIIQTDASINPGNSGGPLLDSHGRMIGVNAAIRSQSGVNTGVGFAIPVNTVKRVVPQLIEKGFVEYPYLGISSLSNLNLADLATEFDLPVTSGVLISEVTPGTAAERAGLRGGTQTVNFRGREVRLGGDIIIAINGAPIHNFEELLGYLVSNTSVGETITLTIVRGDQTLDVPVTLDPRPRD